MKGSSQVLLGVASLLSFAACTMPPGARPPSNTAHSVLSPTAAPVDLPPDAYAYDPRSDPAKASAAAEQQIAQGVRERDVQTRARFLLEMARAVASGGDYARAIHIAEQAMDWAELPPNYRFVLGDAARLWRILRLSSDGISNDFTDDIHPDAMPMLGLRTANGLPIFQSDTIVEVRVPNLSAIRPETSMTSPMTRAPGSSKSPVSISLRPMRSCRKSGKRKMPPYRATKRADVNTMATVNWGFRNSPRSRMRSETTLSKARKSTNETLLTRAQVTT